MLIKQNVVLWILLVGCVVLPKSSKQEKPEDCTKGKQYWSTSLLNPKGTCAPCPHHWKNCDDQPIGDDKRCKDSCRGVKPILLASTPVLSSTPMLTPTSSYIPPEHSKVLPNASIPSAVHSAKPREYKKSSPFDINQYIWLVILLLVILVLVALVVLLVRTPAGNRDGISKNPEEGMALQAFQQNDTEAAERFHEPDDGEDRSQPNNGEDLSQPNDGPPVQATPSSTRMVQGIQEESKDKGLSLVDLVEIHN